MADGDFPRPDTSPVNARWCPTLILHIVFCDTNNKRVEISEGLLFSDELITKPRVHLVVVSFE